MKNKEAALRNRDQSKQKLIDAVSRIIIRDGFKAIGINAVAKEAGLDKVLIYRYFDGLDGLLKEFAQQKDFYLNKSGEIQGEISSDRKHDYKNLVAEILIRQLRDLQENKELQELMLWEMIEKNELTTSIAHEREVRGYELSTILKERMQIRSDDPDAVIAILVSGVYYLVLRSRTVSVFNGVDLSSPAGWGQIETAIRQIVYSYFETLNK